MKRTVTALIALALSGAFTAGGCSSDTNDDDIAEIGPAAAKAYCSLVFSCCTSMEVGMLFDNFDQPKDEAECRSLMEWIYEQRIVPERREDVRAKRQTFDGTKVDACFSSLAGRCGATGSLGDGPFATEPSCQSVFVGIVPDGGDCYSDEDCATAGSTCIDACRHCEPPQLGKCRQPSKEGESCNGLPCAEGLFCGSTSGPDITCQKPLNHPDGTMCESIGECESGNCDWDLNVCAPKKAIGEACNIQWACKEGYCDPDTGVCTALGADGAPCNTLTPERCVSGVCSYKTGTCLATVCDGL